MSQEFTFAQALTEAKQIIVQQAARIKADADKIKIQQEMYMAQSATISEQEKKMREQAGEIDRLVSEMNTLTAKLNEALTAKDQAENIINRQGEKITSLQNTVNEMDRKISEQSEKIHTLYREREGLLEKLPTSEDAEALAAMSALLMKKVTQGNSTGKTLSIAPAPMNLAEAA